MSIQDLKKEFLAAKTGVEKIAIGRKIIAARKEEASKKAKSKSKKLPEFNANDVPKGAVYENYHVIVTKIGNKWVKVKFPNGHVEMNAQLNTVSSEWKIGDAVSFYGAKVTESNRYGVTTTFYPAGNMAEEQLPEPPKTITAIPDGKYNGFTVNRVAISDKNDFYEVRFPYDAEKVKAVKKAGGYDFNLNNTKEWKVDVTNTAKLKALLGIKDQDSEALIEAEKQRQAQIAEIEAKKQEQIRMEREKEIEKARLERQEKIARIEKIADGVYGDYTVKLTGETYIVSFPYSEDKVLMIKNQAGGYGFNRFAKTWKVDVLETTGLRKLIEASKSAHDKQVQKTPKAEQQVEEQRKKTPEINTEQAQDGIINWSDFYAQYQNHPNKGDIITRDGEKYRVTDVGSHTLSRKEIDWQEEAGQPGLDYGTQQVSFSAIKLTEQELQQLEVSKEQSKQKRDNEIAAILDSESFNPKVKISYSEIHFSGIVLQYQNSIGSWSNCGERTDEFLDRCVKFNSGIESRKDAVKTMLDGKTLRNDSADWYSNCRITKDSPININFEIEQKIDGTWTGEAAETPKELLDMAIKARTYGDVMDIILALIDGEAMPLKRYSSDNQIRIFNKKNN